MPQTSWLVKAKLQFIIEPSSFKTLSGQYDIKSIIPISVDDSIIESCKKRIRIYIILP